MSEWKTFKLGDLINVKHGFAFKGEFFSDEPTKDILLTPGNFKIGGGFKTDKLKYYNGDYPVDYILKEGDILITMTDLSKAGDTLGYSAKIPIHSDNELRYLHNQRLGLVQFKNDGIDPDFLYWVLRTKPYQYYIVGSATGSTVKHTSPTRICTYEFQAPKDKQEQKQIAQILTSLDDKIELNLQMNQTLEAMAQAIFKEWCTTENDEIPDGWNVKELAELADVSSSKRIFREEYTLSGVPFYRGKEVTQLSNGESISTELFISNERYEEIKEKFGVPQVGEILITSVGTIGSIWLVDNDSPFYFKDGNVTWIKNYKTQVSGEFIYQWLKTKDAQEQIKSVTIGSTQQALTISALKGLKILIPDKQTVISVAEQLEKINAKRINIINQIHSLAQTRETLLPKLMSGQLEVV